MGRSILTKKGDREIKQMWEQARQRARDEQKMADMKWLQRMREERLRDAAEPTS
jgi:hypothetical protein